MEKLVLKFCLQLGTRSEGFPHPLARGRCRCHLCGGGIDQHCWACPGDVMLRIEAFGACGSDSLVTHIRVTTLQRPWKVTQFRFIPWHSWT
jgi:hypothetical protein